ncbi:MAG: hypothetical protein M3422_10655, partial [Actinomycetota bacterium]|nr:hypothetical protein [Actinomycetota bacterium]
MNPAAKLGGLVLVVAAVFGAAYGIGKVVGPVAAEPKPEAAEHEGMGGGEQDAGHGGGHAASVPKGLQVSEGGVTLDVLTDGLVAGSPTDFAFRILGEDGHA